MVSVDEMFDDAGPTPEQLAEIMKEAKRLSELTAEVAAIESQLEERKKELNTLQFGKLPELVAAAGMGNEIPLGDGKVVKIDLVYRGSLPKDEKREPALQWLKQNGHDPIIKDTITAELGKGQGNIAGEIMGYLEKLEIPAERKEDVNHMTLCALCRDLESKGKDVPLELLGVWSGSQAKVKQKKGK